MRVAIQGLLALIGVVPLTAQTGGFRDSVTVAPGAGYQKSGLFQFFFGAHYRDLWTRPIRVPVLDLTRFAGGLTPTERGGGKQTRSLRLTGRDGREYAFRSIDKDPSVVLPADLRETFADRLFQDQISAGHPTGALVVAPILRAAGVLHAEPVVVMMPNDAALGEFRADFGGVLGLLEERPRDANAEGMSFAGAKEIAGTEKMLDALDDRPAVRVDTRQFLVARLIDVFLGDWDRHRDQWRWALIEDSRGERWVPIPRDRDQAFVRFDGFLLGVVRKRVPQLVNFGDEYPTIVGATWNGRDLDRRLLTELERPVWDSVAAALTSLITNEVVDEAVAALPPEYRDIDGPRLRQALMTRRDGLVAMAERYYEHLAGEVDVYGSDQADLAQVARLPDGTTEVTVRVSGGPVYFSRRFRDRETGDIRIYLQGGADTAIVASGGGISIRVIGGGGADRFVSQGAGGGAFYDHRGDNVAVGGSINGKPYVAIDDTTNPAAVAHRDWGGRKIRYPTASFGPDAGFQFGIGGRLTRYGFRKKPYASYLHYNASIATGAATGRAEVQGRFQRENSRNYLAFDALASGVEVLRWYGFGNDTRLDTSRPVAYYRSTQHQVAFAPSVGWAVGEQATLELGPRFKYSVTEIDEGTNATRFIATDRPFGTGRFAQLGFGGEFRLDSRDIPTAARRGFALELGGSAYPAMMDVDRSFGELHGRVATYLSPRMPGSPTLAVQLGGRKVFGTAGAIPFHEAASLGSTGTLRGFRSHRFAGDEGVIYGTVELRVHLTNLFVLVPGRQGVLGFVDHGRVYHSGDATNPASDTWHSTFGGGVWMAFLTQGSVLSAVVGRSDEGNRVYVRAGFAF
ncbi:MAG: BamA/TamA family outer membrane protein [Gemmatimonadales bacterium]